MEGIIQSQVKETAASEVYELILDKWRASSFSESDKVLLETYSNLETLSFVGCGLKSLANFPVLPNLLKLELSDNKIRGSLCALTSLTSLTMLSLAGNQINSVEQLQEIAGLGNLASLDLFGCPITDMENYPGKVFEMFTHLQVLDGMDINGDEVSVASEEDEEEEDEEEEDDLSDFIEDEEQPVKRRRDSEGSDDECKQKITDL